MGSRRGNGEGTVKQRADGRWEARITVGRGSDGAQLRKSIYGATKGEVIDKKNKLLGRKSGGEHIPTSTPTVKVYLNDWFDTQSHEWKRRTRRTYRNAIDNHLVPEFGHLRLEQLSAQVIQRWLNRKRTENGGKEVRRVIDQSRDVLRSALTYGKRNSYVASNTAQSVTVAKPKKRGMVTLDAASAALFLTAVAIHRLEALFLIVLATGLRLGEVLGLKWDDVDLETGLLTVSRQLAFDEDGTTLILDDLKTENSRRTLKLPRFCLVALRQHRKQQLAERLMAGPMWVETGLMFTTYGPYKPQRMNKDAIRMRATRNLQRGTVDRKIQAGKPLSPRNVLRTLQERVLPAANLPKMTIHQLRHSAASILLAAGVQLEEVSKLLGHSEGRITSKIYSHLQTQTAVNAAEHMDRVLGGRK